LEEFSASTEGDSREGENEGNADANGEIAQQRLIEEEKNQSCVFFSYSAVDSAKAFGVLRILCTFLAMAGFLACLISPPSVADFIRICGGDADFLLVLFPVSKRSFFPIFRMVLAWELQCLNL
jgi:hypothetical protein